MRTCMGRIHVKANSESVLRFDCIQHAELCVTLVQAVQMVKEAMDAANLTSVQFERNSLLAPLLAG